MLYEIPHLRQSNRRYVKRWFTCRDMDLFIWFRKNIPVRFQLAYDKRQYEKAISWDIHRGFHHYLVDTGETTPDRYKQTPLLIDRCDHQNLTVIAREFLTASVEIDLGISDFIYARLMEHPIIPGKHDAVHTDRSSL